MVTKKQRSSSRKRCESRRRFLGSTHGTETWADNTKPGEDPKPLNRPAFRSAFAQIRGWDGAGVRKDEREKRKLRLKKKRRELAKVRKETKRAMARSA